MRLGRIISVGRHDGETTGRSSEDLLRPALEEIIDLRHPLARPAREIDWAFSIGACEWLRARCGLARPPYPAGSGAVHPEAHAQPVGRVAVRAVGGELLFPVLLQRAGPLPQAAARPLVTDTLAPASGRGDAGGADAREPGGGAQDRIVGTDPSPGAIIPCRALHSERYVKFVWSDAALYHSKTDGR